MSFVLFWGCPKIIIRGSSGQLGILATFDNRKLYTPHKITIVISKSSLPESSKDFQKETTVDLKYILGILNSRLIDFYYKSVYGGFIDVYPNNLKSLIIPEFKVEEQAPLIDLVDKIIEHNIQVQTKKLIFIGLLNTHFVIENLSQKLESFYKYDFKAFLVELKKFKIKLSLPQQAEWKDFFEQYKNLINQHQLEIDSIDKQIDQMVFELYGLTESEIKIVEEATA